MMMRFQQILFGIMLKVSKMEQDAMNTELDWTCIKCEEPAVYQLTKEVEVITGYYDDNEGNLQQSIEKKTDVVWACKEHVERYLSKGYELLFSKNVFENLYLQKKRGLEEDGLA